MDKTFGNQRGSETIGSSSPFSSAYKDPNSRLQLYEVTLGLDRIRDDKNTTLGDHSTIEFVSYSFPTV